MGNPLFADFKFYVMLDQINLVSLVNYWIIMQFPSPAKYYFVNM
jgi:hypothetical protein